MKTLTTWLTPIKRYFAAALIVFQANGAYPQISHLIPHSLTCENLFNPEGIDTPSPRLSWKLNATQKAQFQSAYQIMVASTPQKLNEKDADIWNTGKVNSHQNTYLAYRGKTLQSGQKAYWKVRVWDRNGTASEWSAAAYFSVGLLNPSDWVAQWIGAEKALSDDEPYTHEAPHINARYLRKKFTLSKETVNRATLYICGLGLYEAYLNGQKISDYVLAPAQTEFDKRVLYNTFDVTTLLGKNQNTLGCVLGNGRYVNLRSKPEFANVDPDLKFPKVIAQLVIEYASGKKQIVATDTTWKLTADGPIRINNEFDGEVYHAKPEFKNWATNSFNDAQWARAELVPAPKGILTAQMNEPIKVTESISPVKISKLGKKYIVDMGQNMVGWIKLKVNEPKGTTVAMRFAETLQPDGNLYVENLRSAKATDVYMCAGSGTEVYEPTFTYHGFRFVEITGLSKTPQLSDIVGQVVHDAVEVTGTFNCGNSIINQIYKNAYWGIRGNYRSFPTDCPQRDERQGWLGDRGASSKGESFIFNNLNLYKKWLQDIQDAQYPDGVIPDVAPSFYKIYNDGITWPSAYVLIPYFYYQNFGDTSVIENHYEAIKKWAEHTVSFLQNGLTSKDTYGDWCVPPESPVLIHSQDPARKTPPMLLASTYLYQDLKLLKFYAKLTNRHSDTVFCNQYMNTIKSGINQLLFNPVYSQYGNNSMTSNILPLAFDLVPNEHKDKVFRNLCDKLIHEHKGHLATGLIGAQWQMQTLSRFGRADLAYMLASNTTYPSWGYMAENGATTIWELWNGNTADPSMNSGNHVMLLGDLITWLYENVAGLASDIHRPGFKLWHCRPELISGLSYANATVNTPYGKIASAWERINEKFVLTVNVAPNTLAKVYIPSDDLNQVSESDLVLKNHPYVTVTGFENGRVVVLVPSGEYKFISHAYTMPVYAETVKRPTIWPKDTAVAQKPITVSINCATPDSKIYYTLNGEVPTTKSTLYTQPFTLSAKAEVTAIAVKEGLQESFPVKSAIDFYNQAVNGWNYAYYEGDGWTQLPDFSTLKPLATGKTIYLNPTLLKKRADYFGLVFSSKLKINKDGMYTFYLSSDDGSRLIINGKQVIINDFTHAVETQIGSIYLKKGMHDIGVEFFDGHYSEFLKLEYQLDKEPIKIIPVSDLFLK